MQDWIQVEQHVWHYWKLTRCPRLERRLSITVVLSTGNLVDKDVAEDASLVVVLVVAVLMVMGLAAAAAAMHLVVDNLGSSSLGLVARRLGNSLDTLDTLVATLDTLVATLMATLVADHLGNSLDMVEVVPEGVALEEDALQLDRSSATGAARQVISLPIVEKLW